MEAEPAAPMPAAEQPPLPAELAEAPPPLPDEASEPAEAMDADEAGPSGSSDEMEAEPAPELTPEEEERLLKEFFQDLKDVDRDNEVNRILGAFRLNPFEQLDLPFNATEADVKRQYRKVSLMVHPDKCKHPKAQDAFEIVGHAQKELLDADKTQELRAVLTAAREEVRKDRKKVAKNDAVVRLASAIHKEGKEGVEAAYEKTSQFHEAWKVKARDMIAQNEWRKRKLTKRLKEEQLRIEEDSAERGKRFKAEKEHHKEWEKTREGRVGTWRDFAKKGKSKGKNLVLGGIKPPKQKFEDEDKTYIQRPIGEQFRPPPPVAARSRNEK